MSIELVWTALSASGMAVAAWGFFDAWADLRALGERANGRRIHAKGYRRDEAFSFAVHSILLGMGIGPLLNPAPVTLSGFVAALIVVNVLLLVRSIFAAHDRIEVRKAYR
jgi:hypothetical protein